MRVRFISKSSPNCASVGFWRISSSSESMRSSKSDRTGKKLSTSAFMTRYTMTSWGAAISRTSGRRSSCSLHVSERPCSRRGARSRRSGPSRSSAPPGEPVCSGSAPRATRKTKRVVVVDSRPLVEALARLHGQRVEAECSCRRLGHFVVRASSSRSSQKKPVPASAARNVVLGGGRVVCRPGAASPSARRPVSPRTARDGVDRPPPPGPPAAAQPKRAGAKRQRERRLVAGSGTSAMACASTRAEYGPCKQPVGAVAGGDPGVDPARQRANQRPVVGRGRAQGRRGSRDRWRSPGARAPPRGTRATARGGRRP